MVSTPSPPDPMQVATAQGMADVNSVIASDMLNNRNERTPFGSVTYDNVGTHYMTLPDGNRVEVPLRDRVVTLSPSEQAKQNARSELEQGILDTSRSQLSRIQSTLSEPINFGSAPALRGAPGTTGPSDNFARGYGSGGQVRDFNASVNQQRTYASGGNVRELANPGPLLQGYASGGALRDFTADRGYQNRYTTEDVGDTRRRTEDAIFSRLTPQFERDRNQLETQLVNQGLVRGSEAFNNAMDEMRRAETDARMQAVLVGGSELSRDLGERRMAGQFFNDTEQARFVNELSRSAEQRAIQGQRETQSANRAGFANQARQAGFQMQAQTVADNRAAQAQREQQAAARAAFGNQADQAAFGMNLAAAGENRAAQAQREQQSAMQAAFGNQSLAAVNAARAQNTAEEMERAAFNNAARQQAIQESMALRNQPINEMSAALSGTQVNIPQFSAPYRATIPSPPVADSVWRAYEAEAANARAGMSGLFGIGSALIGGLPSLMRSDKRTKTEIKKVGKTDGGTPVYRYRYKEDPSGLFHLGVMAQELQKKQPEAVGEMGGGILGVDYSKVR